MRNIENIEYLFVYGTLRNGYALDFRSEVEAEIEFLSKGKLEGVLYDIGEYPGAVKENEEHEIVGDILAIRNPKTVFKILDDYEGFDKNNIEASEFVRTKSAVRMENGDQISAWVYWYNCKTGDKQKIEYSDYLHYLKSKKSA